jgi:hypothetical protein
MFVMLVPTLANVGPYSIPCRTMLDQGIGLSNHPVWTKGPAENVQTVLARIASHVGRCWTMQGIGLSNHPGWTKGPAERSNIVGPYSIPCRTMLDHAGNWFV